MDVCLNSLIAGGDASHSYVELGERVLDVLGTIVLATLRDDEVKSCRPADAATKTARTSVEMLPRVAWIAWSKTMFSQSRASASSADIAGLW